MIRVIRVTNPIDPSRDKAITELAFCADAMLEDYVRLLHEREFSPGDFKLWAQRQTVSLNGHVWALTLWSQVCPSDGDCIVIVPVVLGGGILKTLASVALLAGTIALTATGVGAAAGAALVGLFGATVSSATAAAIFAGAVSIAGNLLISAFLGPSQPSNKNDSASYDPDGPKSLARSGVVIPKGYGLFRWGGNIISSFTDLAGSDQFLNVLVCFGFGPARSITGIQINGKDIESYQNIQYFTRLGTNDQTEIANFNQIVNGYPQDTQCLAGVGVVVPGTGDLTQALQVDIQFPDGIFVNTSKGNIIPAVITYQVQYRTADTGSGPGYWISPAFPQTTVPVIQTRPDGTAYLPHAWGIVATDLPAAAGVVYATDDGPHNPGDAWADNINCEVFAPNGNHYNYNKPCKGEWQLLDPNMNYVQVTSWTEGYVDFVAAQTTTCYNRTQILGLAPGKYDIQIIKYGCTRLHDDVPFGDNWSPTIGQDMWAHSVNEVSYLDLVYPNMILLGVRALATSQISGSGLNVTALIQHGLRSLDEGLLPAGLLSFEEDNPACIAADMLVDDLYGGGASPGVTAFNLERFIDEWAAWADLNDTLVPDGNGNSIRLHVFNGVHDNESDLWSQLGVVTSMSRACIVPMGLDYGVAVDQLVDAPVQMFTVGNIHQDSFSEIWLPIDDRSTQVEVQFADSTRYYKEDNPLVFMDPSQQNGGTTIKPTRIRAKGITSPAQAFHFAAYKQRSTQYLLRSGSFKTDTDGIVCRPFNVIALQHDVPQWGIGGRTLPGSTASLLLLDRNDAAFVVGTAYSVLLLLPQLQRFSGVIGTVTSSTNPPGFTVTLAGWTSLERVTRALVTAAGTTWDCTIKATSEGSIVLEPPPGFAPVAGNSVVLYDTDVLETAPVIGLDPVSGGLMLGTPLSQVPEDYSTYIYGPTGATKWVRVTQIRKADNQRSTIEWIDYATQPYDVLTPLVGETSAQQISNPGVISLTGSETLQLVAGSYVTSANLSWQAGPDTVGAGIFASFGTGGLPQLVARVSNATSWQAQQSPGTAVTYTVVGYDARNVYASFANAPSVTVTALGPAKNLLQGSSFQSGFTYWNISPRAGDSLVPIFSNDGEAVYTVAGSALTAPNTLLWQEVSPSLWSIGQSLLLSAYLGSAAVPSTTSAATGSFVASLQFTDVAGGVTSVRASLTMAGQAVGLNRYVAAVTPVPAGTVSVAVAILVDGSTLAVPVGATLFVSHLLLETAAAGQTLPSTWADLDITGQVLDFFVGGSSSGLRAQGSVLPVASGSFAYSFTNSNITIRWSGLTIAWPDGSTTQILDGALAEIDNLASSTTYYCYPYFDVVSGGVRFVTAGADSGLPLMLFAAFNSAAQTACYADGRVPLAPNGFTMTTAADSTGGGGGTCGGGDPGMPIIQ